MNGRGRKQHTQVPNAGGGQKNGGFCSLRFHEREYGPKGFFRTSSWNQSHLTRCENQTPVFSTEDSIVSVSVR